MQPTAKKHYISASDQGWMRREFKMFKFDEQLKWF